MPFPLIIGATNRRAPDAVSGPAPAAYAHHPYDSDTEPGMMRCPPYGTSWRNFSPEITGGRGDGNFGIGISMWIRMHKAQVTGSGGYSRYNPVFSLCQQGDSTNPLFTCQIRPGTGLYVWYNGGSSAYSNGYFTPAQMPGTFFEGGWTVGKWLWAHFDISSSNGSSKISCTVADETAKILKVEHTARDELTGSAIAGTGQVLSFSNFHNSEDTTMSRTNRQPMDICNVRLMMRPADEGWTDALSNNWIANEYWKKPIDFTTEAADLNGSWVYTAGWEMNGNGNVMASSPSYQTGLNMGEQNVTFVDAGVDGPLIG